MRPGATLRVYADLLPTSDGTAPFSIHTFNQITGGRTVYPRQLAIANDHFVFTGREADDKQTAISREFAALHGIGAPHYAMPGDGIFHFYFPEQGLVMPGQFIPGADSHSRAYGAYGAVGILYSLAFRAAGGGEPPAPGSTAEEAVLAKYGDGVSGEIRESAVRDIRRSAELG